MQMWHLIDLNTLTLDVEHFKIFPPLTLSWTWRYMAKIPHSTRTSAWDRNATIKMAGHFDRTEHWPFTSQIYNCIQHTFWLNKIKIFYFDIQMFQIMSAKRRKHVAYRNANDGLCALQGAVDSNSSSFPLRNNTILLGIDTQHNYSIKIWKRFYCSTVHFPFTAMAYRSSSLPL